MTISTPIQNTTIPSDENRQSTQNQQGLAEQIASARNALSNQTSSTQTANTSQHSRHDNLPQYWIPRFYPSSC